MPNKISRVLWRVPEATRSLIDRSKVRSSRSGRSFRFWILDFGLESKISFRHHLHLQKTFRLGGQRVGHFALGPEPLVVELEVFARFDGVHEADVDHLPEIRIVFSHRYAVRLV